MAEVSVPSPLVGSRIGTGLGRNPSVPIGTSPESSEPAEQQTSNYVALPVYALTDDVVTAMKSGGKKWGHLRDNSPVRTILVPIMDLPADHIAGD